MTDFGVLIPVAALLAWPIASVAQALVARRTANPDAIAVAREVARLDARMARLEEALDLLTIDVRRVGEVQQFPDAALGAGTGPPGHPHSAES